MKILALIITFTMGLASSVTFASEKPSASASASALDTPSAAAASTDQDTSVDSELARLPNPGLSVETTSLLRSGRSPSPTSFYNLYQAFGPTGQSPLHWFARVGGYNQAPLVGYFPTLKLAMQVANQSAKDLEKERRKPKRPCTKRERPNSPFKAHKKK